MKVEILTFDGCMYSLVVDGVIYAQSRNKKYLERLIEDMEGEI